MKVSTIIDKLGAFGHLTPKAFAGIAQMVERLIRNQ